MSQSNVSHLAAVAAAIVLLPGFLAAQTPVPGTEFVETSDFGRVPKEIEWKADGQVMVLIPAGTYRIGVDDPAGRGFSEQEGPQATVELGSFYIDKFETSHGAYMKQLGPLSLAPPRTLLDVKEFTDDMPVVGISYFDALRYAEGMKKSLPTEAEWEAAARGPQGLLHPWGNEPREGAAALGKGSNSMPDPRGANEADRSPFGVMDMAGNASEWTLDAYQRDYYERVDNQKNPLVKREAAESGSVRGGNFYYKSTGRLTWRSGIVASTVREELGFRTVFRLRPPPTPEPVVAKATPTPAPPPRDAELLEGLMELAKPSFLNPAKALPPELAGRAGATRSAPVVNLGPRPIVLGLISTKERAVFDFPRHLAPLQASEIQVPGTGVFHMVACAEGTDAETSLCYLGRISGDNPTLVLVPPDIFVPSVAEDGSVLPPQVGKRALQMYDGQYIPQWNDFVIFNATSASAGVTARVFDNQRNVAAETYRVLQPGQAAVVEEFPGGKCHLEAQYLGAAEEKNTDDFSFDNNPNADARLFVLVADPKSGSRVQVLTRQLPKPEFRTTEFRLPVELRAKYVPAQKGK